MWLSSWSDWTIFFFVVQIIHFLGTWHLYQKAGRKAWEAAIPVYNAVVMLKIIERPWWWVFILFIPILSPIIMMVLWVDFARSYGKRSLVDALLAIFTLGFYLYYLNYVEKPDYTGPEERKETLISALLFAIMLATFVHTFFVQPMIIPTGSMENTLKIGDALFVSKNAYGTRMPLTPVQVPFSDLFSRNLYVKKLELPYERIPGWTKVERNDIVVFNYPADANHNAIDRKDNYVKRCVATAGDSIKIEDGEIWVNGKPFEIKGDAHPQKSYFVETKSEIKKSFLEEEFGLVPTDYKVDAGQDGSPNYTFYGLTQEQLNKIKQIPSVTNIIEGNYTKEIVGKGLDHLGQPLKTGFLAAKKWNRDQMGNVYVPKKGDQINLTLENLPIYKDAITLFEGNELTVKDGQIYINGEAANTYTFQQNYYFMVGDNRHNSLDSRFWGFVPDSHVIGKPFFIWANLNQLFGFEKRHGFQFDRWFTIPNNGERNKTSYLLYFVIAVALFQGYSYWKNRNKKEKES